MCEKKAREREREEKEQKMRKSHVQRVKLKQIYYTNKLHKINNIVIIDTHSIHKIIV